MQIHAIVGNFQTAIWFDCAGSLSVNVIFASRI